MTKKEKALENQRLYFFLFLEEEKKAPVAPRHPRGRAILMSFAGLYATRPSRVRLSRDVDEKGQVRDVWQSFILKMVGYGSCLRGR